LAVGSVSLTELFLQHNPNFAGNHIGGGTRIPEMDGFFSGGESDSLKTKLGSQAVEHRRYPSDKQAVICLCGAGFDVRFGSHFLGSFPNFFRICLMLRRSASLLRES
jgi:hypothetical protein